MCLHKRRHPRSTNHPDVRTFASVWVQYIKSVGFRVNARDDLFARPFPSCPPEMCDVLVRTESVRLYDTSYLNVWHCFYLSLRRWRGVFLHRTYIGGSADLSIIAEKNMPVKTILQSSSLLYRSVSASSTTELAPHPLMSGKWKRLHQLAADRFPCRERGC